MRSLLEDVWSGLRPDVQFFLHAGLATVVDGLFLVMWVSVQYGANGLIEGMDLSGVDRLVFWVFQWLLGMSTVAPVLSYIWGDFVVMYKNGAIHLIRARREVAAEQAEGMTLGTMATMQKDTTVQRQDKS